eukprot:gene15234-biopygen12710
MSRPKREKRRCQRPVRVRFFECYRPARVRPAPGPRPLPFPKQGDGSHHGQRVSSTGSDGTITGIHWQYHGQYHGQYPGQSRAISQALHGHVRNAREWEPVPELSARLPQIPAWRRARSARRRRPGGGRLGSHTFASESMPQGSQDTGAGVARAWRGHGAGVARAWRGHVLFLQVAITGAPCGCGAMP